MIDPINYDVAELRALAQRHKEAAPESSRIEADGFRWLSPPPAAHERPRAEALLSPEQRRRLLLLHGVPFDPVDATPVLSTLPPDSTPLAFAWLTAPVTGELHEYLGWIALRERAGLAAVDRTDHLLSFASVAAIAAQQTAPHGPHRPADGDG